MAARQFIWKGPAPPPALGAMLDDRKLGVVTKSSEALPAVLFSPTIRRVPREFTPATWVWLCPKAISQYQAIDATLLGAYATISLTEADAHAQLIARLEELLRSDTVLQPPQHIVSISQTSQLAIAHVARVAATSMPVLLTGETGTGKEVMARLIHAWSPRRRKSFVPINCAAIPNELMEAELFGYARGAFSGAVQRYEGQLTAAEGGTVLLDEIDDTPLETQVKLLRVLEDRVVNRLGENTWHEVDFRLLAATNRDLRTLVDAGLFGADLYERLAIVSIHLAPLRERLEDLPELARHFMQRFAREQQKQVADGIRREALQALLDYPWPGNIRELRNVIFETLAYKRGGSEILLADLPKRILRREGDLRQRASDPGIVARKIEGGTMNLREEVAALERTAVEAALKRTGGNAAQAARLLGEVGRGAARDPGGTLRAMMKRLSRSGPTPRS